MITFTSIVAGIKGWIATATVGAKIATAGAVVVVGTGAVLTPTVIIPAINSQADSNTSVENNGDNVSDDNSNSTEESDNNAPTEEGNNSEQPSAENYEYTELDRACTYAVNNRGRMPDGSKYDISDCEGFKTVPPTEEERQRWAQQKDDWEAQQYAQFKAKIEAGSCIGGDSLPYEDLEAMNQECWSRSQQPPILEGVE